MLCSICFSCLFCLSHELCVMNTAEGECYLWYTFCHVGNWESWIRYYLQCQWVDSQKSQASLSHCPPSSALAGDVCHTLQTTLGIRPTPHGLQTCESCQSWMKGVARMQWWEHAVVALWSRSAVPSRLRYCLLVQMKGKETLARHLDASRAFNLT